MRDTGKGEIRKRDGGSTRKSATRWKCMRELSRCRPRRNPIVFLQQKKKEKGGRKYCVSDFRQNVGRIRIGVIHTTQGLQDTRTRKRDASKSARRS